MYASATNMQKVSIFGCSLWFLYKYYIIQKCRKVPNLAAAYGFVTNIIWYKNAERFKIWLQFMVFLQIIYRTKPVHLFSIHVWLHYSTLSVDIVAQQQRIDKYWVDLGTSSRDRDSLLTIGWDFPHIKNIFGACRRS